jgi:hypothetical protein
MIAQSEDQMSERAWSLRPLTGYGLRESSMELASQDDFTQ